MRKSYTPEFKTQVVLEVLKEEKTMNEIASAHGIHVNQIRQWRNAFLEQMPKVGSSLFGMGKDKIIVGLTWSLCGHDYEAKPLINKENWLSHNRLSCPPLHVKPPKLLLLPI